MSYAFDAISAAKQSNDPDYETYDEIYALFNEVDSTASRRSVEPTWPKKDGLVIGTGELGEMQTVTLRVDPTTGKFVVSYSPQRGNVWASRESDLTAIYGAYIYNPTAIAAQVRARESRGLMDVVKPGEEGLEVGTTYLPPGVPATIASFLTGEKGSLKQQKASLKAKATGKGRRKTRKTKSKTRTIRRR